MSSPSPRASTSHCADPPIHGVVRWLHSIKTLASSTPRNAVQSLCTFWHHVVNATWEPIWMSPSTCTSNSICSTMTVKARSLRKKEMMMTTIMVMLVWHHLPTASLRIRTTMPRMVVHPNVVMMKEVPCGTRMANKPTTTAVMAPAATDGCKASSRIVGHPFRASWHRALKVTTAVRAFWIMPPICRSSPSWRASASTTTRPPSAAAASSATTRSSWAPTKTAATSTRTASTAPSRS
mmetsp:Transcript_28768/g.81142  ORF Transcript_28768/g.81142 Transcript_28768/m.81142 type:complete len:237 (-) Transcript_28768:973-1683(-)